MGRKGSVHLRKCKRCGKIFRTPFKHGVVCLDCYVGRRNNNHNVYSCWLRGRDYGCYKKELDKRIKRGLV